MLKCQPGVLDELQVRAIRAVGRVSAARAAPHLWLAGDAALAAFYLGHREPDGLEFSASRVLDARAVGEPFREELRWDGIEVEAVGTANAGRASFHVRKSAGRNAASVCVTFAVTSAVLLEPPQSTEAGVAVASFRDVCAWKLGALAAVPAAIARSRLNDRLDASDYVDLHAILNRLAGGKPVNENVMRARFRSLLDDLLRIDSGNDARYVGQGFARAIDKPLLSLFPLRLLKPLTDAEIQATLRLCFDECARLVNDLSPEL